VGFPLRWRLGDVAFIAVNAFLMFSAWTLGERRKCQNECVKTSARVSGTAKRIFVVVGFS
jgi:hypothetical protein